MPEYCVPQPMTVWDALYALYPDSSRRSLQQWMRAGRFTVDGKAVTRGDMPLEAHQLLQAQEQLLYTQKKGALRVLYSDRYLIAIDKPVGLLSVPLDDRHGTDKHALGMLRRHFHREQIYAVHRLDRESSGVLMFACGKESQEKLKDKFFTHDIRRDYFAIVEGRIRESKGTWKSSLQELPSYDVVVANDPDEGRDAITHFSVQRRSTKYSYLQLQLETGRKHQIRVHCASAGHPIVGDKRYGAIENPMKRLGLHAYKLSFNHPFTDLPMSFTAPLPGAFEVLGAKIG